MSARQLPLVATCAWRCLIRKRAASPDVATVSMRHGARTATHFLLIRGRARSGFSRAASVCAWFGDVSQRVGSQTRPRLSRLARFGHSWSWSREGCLFWSFVYLVVRNLFALVWLLGRPRRSKELEILVLRHELTILRRQAAPGRG